MGTLTAEPRLLPSDESPGIVQDRDGRRPRQLRGPRRASRFDSLSRFDDGFERETQGARLVYSFNHAVFYCWQSVAPMNSDNTRILPALRGLAGAAVIVVTVILCLVVPERASELPLVGSASLAGGRCWSWLRATGRGRYSPVASSPLPRFWFSLSAGSC